MFQSTLPDVPNLFVQASIAPLGGSFVSATGVGSSPHMASQRHDSERAERLVCLEMCQGMDSGNALQRPDITGMAAGRDSAENVRARAILELIERRACLSWWSGHLPAKRPNPHTLGAFERAKAMWPRRKPRKTGLLTAALPSLPQVCIAWSCDAEDRSICFGAACRMDGADAAIAALWELYQMEFGLSVIHHRNRNGVALTASETRILERANELNLGDLSGRLATKATAGGPLLADLDAAIADANLEISLRWVTKAAGGHRVAVVTCGQDAAHCAPIHAQDDNLRWRFYGA